jgi:3-oxoacyl-[acyl-carrier-protein] synthase II
MNEAKSKLSKEGARGEALGSPTFNGRRRVVITGLGAFTPLGNDPEETWQNLLVGESGAAEITHFDHADYPIHFACEVKDFDPAAWIDRKRSRRMDRFAQLIVAAARQAEQDSGIDIAKEADRIGASIATGIGGLQSFQDCYDVLISRGPDRVNPFAIPCIIPNMGAGWVSMELGTRGPLSSECTACAASNMAIGQGLDDIRLGRADVMLCGGTESAINKVGIAGFAAMRALSRRNDDPKRASRPFDAERDGFVMGEAAAILVLEEFEHAKARGAKIYAEVVGHGLSSDATHITEPDPTGENPARAMRNALRDAGVDPSQVDYVNAHGTSTPLGDASETRVIKMALGEEKARQTPISSTKGATGHCLGAGGAVEAIFTTLAIRDGKLPPTINYEVEDPDCDLDYIPNVAREAEVRVAVSNSFGFGGHNACVVVRASPARMIRESPARASREP